MFTCLSPGAIGVRATNLKEAIEAARIGGFEGVEFNPHEVADLVEKQGADYVKSLFAHADVRPGAFGLPVEWRGDIAKWQEGLADLPRVCSAAVAIGCNRTATWVPPASNTLPFEENWRFHVERFGPIAKILADVGCYLGLEFIGPLTSRRDYLYPFIYTMHKMLELAHEIGPNVGLLLDSWHWYTSNGTVEDIERLHKEEVVYVHINDAPAGIPRDEQIDNQRALPGETGVIDITGFLRALHRIGYDGPVTPEPFKAALSLLSSDEERLRTVGVATRSVFRRAFGGHSS